MKGLIEISYSSQIISWHDNLRNKAIDLTVMLVFGRSGNKAGNSLKKQTTDIAENLMHCEISNIIVDIKKGFGITAAGNSRLAIGG